MLFRSIDGIARVASAIRERRKEEINLLAVPMRIIGVGSSEYSDAKARAVSELVRTGGFSNAAVQEDIKNLAIPSVDSIPSYETLAPFVASDPKFDQLTLNYAQLASRLVGKDLTLPKISSKTIDLVKRRLLPRHATEEYLENLSAREPESAIIDLQQLTQSALESIVNEEYIDPDYVIALVKACDSLSDNLDDLAEIISIKMAAIDLLRGLTIADPGTWGMLLVDKLSDIIDFHGYSLEHEAQLALLEELDIILATSSTINHQLRRIEFRRKAAWVYVEASNVEALNRTIGEISALKKDISGLSLAQDQLIASIAIDIDVFRLKAEVEILKGAFQLARAELTNALELISKTLSKTSSTLLYRLKFNVDIKFTELPRPFVSVRECAEHALAAASNNVSAQRVVTRFLTLSKIVLESGCDSLAVQFCEALFSSDQRVQLQLGNHYGRYPKMALEFFKVVRELVVIVSKHEDRSRSFPIFTSVSETASQVRKGLIRRRRTVGDKDWELLEYEFDLLTGLFLRVGVHVETHTSELENRFFMRAVLPGRLPEEDE